MVIGDISSAALSVSLTEKELSLVQAGQAVNINISGADMTGAVKNINPVALKPSTLQSGAWGEAIVTFDAAPSDIIIGCGAHVDISVTQKDGALVIPSGAVLSSPGGYYVYTVSDGKAARTPVTLGLRNDDLTEVTGGISAGDRVVTESSKSLSDGRTVNIVNRRG